MPFDQSDKRNRANNYCIIVQLLYNFSHCAYCHIELIRFRIFFPKINFVANLNLFEPQF